MINPDIFRGPPTRASIKPSRRLVKLLLVQARERLLGTHVPGVGQPVLDSQKKFVKAKQIEATPGAPERNGQIKFTEWTRDDRLRQPVFLGIREDKNANEVVREKAS